MPDARLRKTRATLPDGYQFGDSALYGRQLRERLQRIQRRESDVLGVAAWQRERDERASQAAQAADDADDAHDATAWRSLHENNADRLARRQRSPGWNTIEPD